MKGLILKDIINLKKNIMIMIVAMVFYAVMSFTQKDPSFFSSLFTLFFAILILSTYSLDEMVKWDGYALTMPITKEDIVKSKYGLVILMALFGMLFTSVFVVGFNVIMNKDNVLTGTPACGVGAAIVILFYSITIPFLTKFGVEKARLIVIGVYMFPYLIGLTIWNKMKEGAITIPESVLKFWDNIMEYSYIFAFLALVVIFGISYRISVHIYKKKEF